MRKKWNSSRVAALSLASTLVAGGALAGAAGPASAQTTAVRVEYTCTTSLGPDVTLTAWVVGGLPDDGAGPNSVANHDYAYIDVDLDLRELRPALAIPGGVRLDGDSTATLDARIVGPDGTRTTQAAFTLAPTWLTTTEKTAVRAAGSFPVQQLSTPGNYDLRVDDLTLALRPERADGTPLGTVTASCSHDPAQNDLLGTVASQAAHFERPPRPRLLRVVSTTPTSVTLAWEGYPWWNPTKGYEVYLDGGNTGLVTEEQVTLTGLTPDRQHRAKVVTVDVQGIRSTLSQGLIFTLPRA
ncbi:fibronectin type III domain-containing protein [Saccharothrix sp. S26]|uniref:fibronectin type III domain-containing protein n=1 Tax=Saccharothrix sp. S26 TaxID=2907215 RepID=UPI001F253D33|nr:fibronectin type III domain-containing protein [Saccharothrix sp. S26]MCE6998392.1 fibronectin type III domain-containing protein [Saccharothrix sp. S26]